MEATKVALVTRCRDSWIFVNTSQICSNEVFLVTRHAHGFEFIASRQGSPRRNLRVPRKTSVFGNMRVVSVGEP